MFKIYYLDNLLALGQDNAITTHIETRELSNKLSLISFVDQWIKNDKRTDTCINTYAAENMLNDLKGHFHFVEAAGGVVRNRNQQLLFIKRWGIWDLPKGKREKGEKIEDCALREVNEETGIAPLRIIDVLPSSYHLYLHKQKTILKKTYWFHMETDFEGVTTPQQEEDITQADWLNKTACQQALSESYRSLRESLSSAICKLL